MLINKQRQSNKKTHGFLSTMEKCSVLMQIQSQLPKRHGIGFLILLVLITSKRKSRTKKSCYFRIDQDSHIAKMILKTIFSILKFSGSLLRTRTSSAIQNRN